MGIQKQEFYEGAALHQIIRRANGTRITYAAPLFVVDDVLQLHLKYSTAIRSPWSFTFTLDEQVALHGRASDMPLVIGLICGADGIATVPFDNFIKIAGQRETAVRIACYRRHREHFEVSGPAGTIPGKIPPSNWQKLLTK